MRVAHAAFQYFEHTLASGRRRPLEDSLKRIIDQRRKHLPHELFRTTGPPICRCARNPKLYGEFLQFYALLADEPLPRETVHINGLARVPRSSRHDPLVFGCGFRSVVPRPDVIGL